MKWKSPEVPHALLDIGRGCNITCRACYNTVSAEFKAVEDVRKDLELLLAKRNLDSVSILGGETMLHPDILEIVRMVRDHNVHVELFSNGLMLNEENVEKLHEAGTDSIFLHIEKDQNRKDLPSQDSVSALKQLIAEKANLVSRHGISAGITFTAFRDELDSMLDVIRFTIDNSDIEYMLITLYREMQLLGKVSGDIETGLRTEEPGIQNSGPDSLTLQEIKKLMEENLKITPFSRVPSNLDPSSYRWLSYLVGKAHFKNGDSLYRNLSPSRFEPFYFKLHRRLSGRYSFSQKNKPALFRFHLLLNSLLGGSISSNSNLLIKGLLPGTSLRWLRIVFQCPAEALEDGRIVHCMNCPDAVVKNGKLVPVCLCDQVV